MLGKMELRLLTYNIHKGFGWGRKNYFLPALKEFIQKSEADIVFLQEVVGQNELYKKRGLVDAQMEYLAESVFGHSSYALNARYLNGNHGNLILSKYPIESWVNFNLSTNFLEKRGLLLCKILLPFAECSSLYAGCVHLDLLHRGRKLQYQTIHQTLTELDDFDRAPLVLAGDFNDWNKGASKVFRDKMGMQEAYHTVHGRYANTFPSHYPALSLDRIYVRNLKVNSAGRGAPTHIFPNAINEKELHLSDHLPLMCDVEIS